MDFVHQNPYRILGLAINASTREIEKRISELLTYAEMGKNKSYDTDFPWLSPVTRTSETIHDAARKLEQPDDRVFHSLFWFWSYDSVDQIALDVLKEGNKNKAIQLWDSNSPERKKSLSNAKNLAVICIADSGLDSMLNPNSLTKGISNMGKVMSTNVFDSYVKYVLGEKYSIDKDKLIRTFLDAAFRMMSPHIGINRVIPYQYLKSIFISFDNAYQDYVVAYFTTKPIKQIEEAINESISLRKQSPQNADDVLKSLAITAKEPIIILSELLGIESLLYQDLADKVALEIDQCGTDYYNYHTKDKNLDPGDKTLAISNVAYSFAVGSHAKSKINDGIECVKEYIRERPERVKRAKIEKDLDFIIEQIDKLPDSDNLSSYEKKSLARTSQNLIDNCGPKLKEICSVVGDNDDLYMRVSTRIVTCVLSMCIDYANETKDISTVVSLLNKISHWDKETECEEWFDRNYTIFKKQNAIKPEVDNLFALFDRLPDVERISSDQLKNIPNVMMSFIASAAPLLTNIRKYDNNAYLDLSSTTVSVYLNKVVDFANRRKDWSEVINLCRYVKGMDMENEVIDRYNQIVRTVHSNSANEGLGTKAGRWIGKLFE